MWRLKILRSFYKFKAKLTGKVISEKLLVAWSAPLPKTNLDWKSCEFFVVDTETSGLTTDQGELLSIGWVNIEQGKIPLKTAQHFLIENQQGVGQSAVIHQIRDCELKNATPPEDIADGFLLAAKGKVLVFHHAPMDMGFINAACQKFYGAPLLMPVVDTLRLEKIKLQSRQISIGQGVLTLAQCRGRYGLPSYPAHNALSDALATAELLLAQIQYKDLKCRLRQLL